MDGNCEPEDFRALRDDAVARDDAEAVPERLTIADLNLKPPRGWRYAQNFSHSFTGVPVGAYERLRQTGIRADISSLELL